MVRKRTDLSLKQKIEVINLAGENASQSKIAERFDCSQSQISRILKEKDAIQARAAAASNGARKRMRTGKDAQVERALCTWFRDARASNAIINQSVLEAKAKELSDMMGKDFNPTNGWISRWKAREGIVFKRAHGEKTDADSSAADDWVKKTLPGILANYASRDVFNADETGIYYKLMPNGTLCFRSEDISGSKKNKERVTVMVAANMDGSEKLSLLVVGKSKNPRCLRGVSLPVTYSYSKNAWMTSAIFQTWLTNLNERMRKEGRSILLLVDNCSAHPKGAADNLSNIKLQFLPPNTTALIQPCDQGIIKCLKHYYRDQVISRIERVIDGKESEMTAQGIAKATSLLDALHMLRAAWGQVTEACIANCWRKAHFFQTPFVDEEPLSPPEGFDAESFSAFVHCDDSLECHGSLSTSEIVQLTEEDDPQQEAEETDELDEDPPLEPVRARDAFAAIYTLRAFVAQQAGSDEAGKLFDCVYSLETRLNRLVSESSIKQTRINDFFKK
jgi:transposase